MKFPLKKYTHDIPTDNHLGAFGTIRKFDIHTGIDLYCEYKSEVIAIEDGQIIAIKPFTGEKVDMPWWNDTDAIAIKGSNGIFNYGEVLPKDGLKEGDFVKEGDVIGYVIPVLKKDKGKVPSINMLHLEWYLDYDGEWVLWELGTQQPKNLLDPTNFLKELVLCLK